MLHSPRYRSLLPVKPRHPRARFVKDDIVPAAILLPLHELCHEAPVGPDNGSSRLNVSKRLDESHSVVADQEGDADRSGSADARHAVDQHGVTERLALPDQGGQLLKDIELMDTLMT